MGYKILFSNWCIVKIQLSGIFLIYRFVFKIITVYMPCLELYHGQGLIYKFVPISSSQIPLYLEYIEYNCFRNIKIDLRSYKLVRNIIILIYDINFSVSMFSLRVRVNRCLEFQVTKNYEIDKIAYYITCLKNPELQCILCLYIRAKLLQFILFCVNS